MARIRLFHWKAAEAQATLDRLRTAGHEVDYQEQFLPALLSELKRSPPDAVLIDLSRLPSHGREVAVSIRGSKSTRHLPLVFAGGAAEKLEAIRTLLPDASYCEPEAICAAIQRALKDAPAKPVIPVQMMDRFAARTVCQKLGIGEGARVLLIDPPRDHESVLAPLPKGIQFIEDAHGGAAVTLWFVRDRHALESSLRENRRLASSSKLWIVWPKQKRGSRGGITETMIREDTIAVGLVDYKVCAVNETWSAMLFALKKAGA